MKVKELDQSILPFVLSPDSVCDYSDYPMNIRNYNKSKPCKVVSVKEMRQKTSEGSTLEVIFDTTGLKYKTAGNLAVYAENSDHHVQKFAQRMKYDLNMAFALVPNSKYEGKK